jgi:hypothetical protein
MTAEEVQLPTSLSYTEDDVANAATRPQLAEGWYRFVITNAKRTESRENGHLMINQTLTPLSDPDDADSKASPNIFNNLCFPHKNKNRADHKPPNTAGICHGFLMAIYDDMPDYPRMVDGTLTYNGEAIDREDENACRQEVTKEVFERLNALWEDPDALLDEAVYGQVHINGQYVNVKNIRAELPEDAELVPASEMTQRKACKRACKGFEEDNQKESDEKEDDEKEDD